MPPAFTRLDDRAPGGGMRAAFVDALAATFACAEVALVLAIDLPLVDASWLAALAVQARVEKESCVPSRDERFEPLAAAWHCSALPLLRETIAQNKSLQEACAALREKSLLHALALDATEAASLANLNTPAEAARLGFPA